MVLLSARSLSNGCGPNDNEPKSRQLSQYLANGGPGNDLGMNRVENL